MSTFSIDQVELRQLIDKVVKRTMKMDFAWDWPGGVAFYGICEAWKSTGEQEYLDFLVRWVDDYIERGIPPFTVNAISIGHTMITLYEATEDEKYLNMAKQMAEHLTHEAVRFGEGVFQHTVSQNYNFPEQAWADTLFMAAYFLLRIGVKLNNEEYIKDGLNQYYWHEEFLQDNQSNLYYHGWDHIKQNNMSSIYWARANAWAALTMGEALQLITVTNPSFMMIEGSLRDQLAALVRLQSDRGLWHTVLTNPESYEEISASAGIAAGLISYEKVLGQNIYTDYIQKAYRGIVDNIAEDGRVMNVSAGTAVMDDEEGYKQVPKKRIQGWGQGLTLAFLAKLVLADKNA